MGHVTAENWNPKKIGNVPTDKSKVNKMGDVTAENWNPKKIGYVTTEN
jgi:hypothetical protein